MRTLSNFSIKAPWAMRFQKPRGTRCKPQLCLFQSWVVCTDKLKSHLLGWHPFSVSPLPSPEGVGCKAWPSSCSVWAQCPSAAFNHKPATPPHGHLQLSWPGHCCMAQLRGKPCPPHFKLPEHMINWYICKKKKDDEELLIVIHTGSSSSELPFHHWSSIL